MTVGELNALVFGVAMLAFGGVRALEWYRERRAPGPVERAKREFAAGDISEAEFHRRLELHLDERNEEIRTAVEEIDGVGEEMSKEVALRFESIDELADASREELEDIHGVGESTSRAIVGHLDRRE